MQKILVLGASGMLGHKMFETLSSYSDFDVYGTVTSKNSFQGLLPTEFDRKIIEGVFADKIETVETALNELKPNIVINCIGAIKQKKGSKSTAAFITLNSLFPHQVATLCDAVNATFITIATDCVFDGKKGSPYLASEEPTCHDVYGMSKYLGELHEDRHLSLRTSIIGHELHSGVSLLDWFLGVSEKTAKGFTKAIFSGFPTVVLAKLIAEKIIPRLGELHGLYHISNEPISKYDLLSLVAEIYTKPITLVPDESLVINRALNSDILREKIGYNPPSWRELIATMHQDFIKSSFYTQKRKRYDFINL